MKKLLNTLYVTSQGSYLSKDGECVVVRNDEGEKRKFPIHIIDSIVCFGNVLCSPFLLGHCADNDVAVSFLTQYGRYLAGVHGPQSGNVVLRKEQYRQSEDPEKATILARSFLIGKVINSQSVLRRVLRDHKEKVDVERIQTALEEIRFCIRRLEQALSVEEARGLEGRAAAIYFNVFNELITQQKEDFVFAGRNRKPPLDAVNCLLSFVYTLLAHDIRSALESVGLDPQVGFLHKDRSGRPSLALDIMEEYRAFMADRLVLSLINRGEVHPKHFIKKESGAIHMCDDARKKVLEAWQKRKATQIVHPFLQEKAPLGITFHLQARLLARYLRGDLDAYPPFFWK